MGSGARLFNYPSNGDRCLETHLEVPDVLDRIRSALQTLLARDNDLFESDVWEPTLMHKFAEYLQPLFPEFNVDCEYNRNGNGPKRLPLSRGLGSRGKRPDIVVHRRRSNEHNLVIIEGKKSNDRRRGGIERDRRKVEAFVEEPPYSYRLGVFIIFNVHRKDAPPYELRWYQNGEWTEMSE
jgi:hypothetical protein